MASLHRVGSLEITDDQDFTRTSWILERVGWGILAAVVAAALAGILGPGPLSNAEAAGPDGGLRIEYERFVRFETGSELRLFVRAGGEPREVWLDRAYVDRVKIERIRPEPVQTALEAGRVTYRFPAAPAGSDDEVVFDIAFRTPGRLQVRAGARGVAPVEFVQVVYP